MEQVRRENPLIFSRGVAITRKLGFPDVIMPGESRIQLHVGLPITAQWAVLLNTSILSLRNHTAEMDSMNNT